MGGRRTFDAQPPSEPAPHRHRKNVQRSRRRSELRAEVAAATSIDEALEGVRAGGEGAEAAAEEALNEEVPAETAPEPSLAEEAAPEAAPGAAPEAAPEAAVEAAPAVAPEEEEGPPTLIQKLSKAFSSLLPAAPKCMPSRPALDEEPADSDTPAPAEPAAAQWGTKRISAQHWK